MINLMFDGRLYRRTAVRLPSWYIGEMKTHDRASLHRVIFKPQRQHMNHQPGQQVGDAAQSE